MKARIKKIILTRFPENTIISILRIVEIKKFLNKRRIAIWKKNKLSKKQKRQIDSFYKNNLGKKIPYIWHRHYSSFTGNFDVNYFPELLFIPEFQRYMNQDYAYVKTFSDKNILPYIANVAKIKTPATFLTCANGVYRNSENIIISKEEAVRILSTINNGFIKPSVDSCSGNGCSLISFENCVDLITGKKALDILTKYGRNFLLQERIECHDTIRKLYPKSVNTLRVISYIWKDEIKILPIVMRIGCGGGYLDNAHAGGIFIAVDFDGSLHQTAYTEFKKEYNEHPDSHIKFKGYKIEGVDKVIEATKKLHSLIPQIGLINWDFTVGAFLRPPNKII